MRAVYGPEMIARSETKRALEMGARASFESAGVTKIEWCKRAGRLPILCTVGR